ncbi:hypothetical protein HK096_002759, partial [Nowakowskiella sp. JEL0078]
FDSLSHSSIISAQSELATETVTPTFVVNFEIVKKLVFSGNNIESKETATDSKRKRSKGETVTANKRKTVEKEANVSPELELTILENFNIPKSRKCHSHGCSDAETELALSDELRKLLFEEDIKDIKPKILQYFKKLFKLQKQQEAIDVIITPDNPEQLYIVETNMYYCFHIGDDHTTTQHISVKKNGEAYLVCDACSQKSDPLDVEQRIMNYLEFLFDDNKGWDGELIEKCKEEAKELVNQHFENNETKVELVQNETDRTFNATLTNTESCTQFGHFCEKPDIIIVNTGYMYYFQCCECCWKFPEVGILVPSRFKSLQEFHINSTTNGTESTIILDREEYLNDAYKCYPNEDLNIAFKKTFTGGHAEMGKFLALLYQDKLVSSGAKSKSMWFHFNGNRWEIHDSDIIISKIISSNKIQDLYRRAIKSRLIELPSAESKIGSTEKSNLFKNGVYDLDNNNFRSAKADDFITLSTGYDYVTYTDTSPEYVELIEFLKKIIPIPDVLHYVLKFLTSAISGYTPDEYLHIFIGEGANGKSTLIRLMEATLGELATTLKTTFLKQKSPPADTPSPSIAKTVNKRFVSLQEVNKNENLNESLVKQMTGNDKLDFRQLYGKSEDFRPQFKLVMCTNHPVKIHGTDHGIWRRIRMVPFNDYKSISSPRDELFEAFKNWKETHMDFEDTEIKFPEFNKKMSSLFGCGDQANDKITTKDGRTHGWYGITLKKDPFV